MQRAILKLSATAAGFKDLDCPTQLAMIAIKAVHGMIRVTQRIINIIMHCSNSSSSRSSSSSSSSSNSSSSSSSSTSSSSSSSSS